MPTQHILAGETVVWVGDSITAGTPPPAGWWTPAAAAVAAGLNDVAVGAVSGGHVGATTGNVAGAVATVGINSINSGVGGNKAADIAAAVPARILAFNPQNVVLEVGVNDATAATSLAAFRASVDSIFTQVLAALPACRLWAMSIFVWHEQWNAGPVWANPFDPPPPFTYTPSIVEYNAQLQASVESFGGIFVETRNETLAYEAAHNLPVPGAVIGPLTIDGLHPNSLGQGLMSSRFLTTVQIGP